jgi:hypothetical protein
MGLRNQFASEPRANLLFQEVIAIETDLRAFWTFGVQETDPAWCVCCDSATDEFRGMPARVPIKKPPPGRPGGGFWGSSLN